MLWKRAKTVGMVFHIAKLRTKIKTNKRFTRKVANFFIFLLLVRGWVFCSSLKNVYSSSVKKERGASFLRQPKTGTNVTSKFTLVSIFSKSLFSNTDRCFCLFVRLFVCLRAREEAYVKCSFALLYNTFFWHTKSAVFATQFAHCFCTQFLHHFAYNFDCIFDANWSTFWCNLGNFSDTFLSTNLQSKSIDLFFKK